MKGILETKEFKARYKKRISKNEALKKDFLASVEAFLDDRRSVDDHQLEGKMKAFRAFSMNNDYRVIYRDDPDKFIFINIGTHEEVYN